MPNADPLPDPPSVATPEPARPPPDRAVTFHGPIFGAPYPALVFAGIAAAVVALFVAPGGIGDRIAAGGWTIIGVHVLSSALSVRTRVTFHGWAMTSRTAIGPAHTFDVREVHRIRRRPRRLERSDGRDFLTRIARRPHDYDVFVAGRPRPVRLPLHQFPYDGGPAAELMQRLAALPGIDADPDTAETLAAWRRVRGLPTHLA